MSKSSIPRKSDQCSVISRLIMRHVMKERPDYVEFAKTINCHRWVIMKDLPDNCDSLGESYGNEIRRTMCGVVLAHGEFATIRPCLQNSEPYCPGFQVYVIHLSRWEEFFVEFHTDYYDFADATGGGTATELLRKKTTV